MGLRDLSHDLTSGDPYPGDPPASVAAHATIAEDGYRLSEIACSTHSGTHVDAPSHLVDDAPSLGAFDIEDFRFDARLLDCTDVGSREPISADRIPGSADEHTDLVVVRTDWSDRWGEQSYFDHPYLAPEAARCCADQGFALGLDAPSVDPTPTENTDAGEPTGYPAHEALLGAGSVILENLTGLDDLPERFTVHAYPIPVDADGAPARPVAEW